MVVQQVHEAEPIQAQHLHGGEGMGITAVTTVVPDDVLVAKDFAGTEAGFLPLRIYQFDDAPPHTINGLRCGPPLINRGAGWQGDGLTVQLRNHQFNRGATSSRLGYDQCREPPGGKDEKY
jgi:hypothetical protein